MNLNQRSPKAAEQRRKKRQRLEEYALGTIRSYLKNEIPDIAPPEWTTEMRDELEEAKITESKRIIEALSTSELENEFAMERHGESMVAEVRMEVHRRTAEERKVRI
jgi:hypothetical protein